MIENKEFTCVVCPRGCRLVVSIDDRTVRVSGNACARGEDYGRQEAVEPMRSFTTTVRVTGGQRDRLPVRATGDIPLARILEAMDALDSVEARAPVKVGDTVLSDLLGLSVDVITTDEESEIA